MAIGEVYTEKPENAVIIDLEQLWKSVSGDFAKVEHLAIYKARLEDAAREIAKRPGAEVVLYGRAPIWLYVVAFHVFHFTRRVYVYDPKCGYIVVAEHLPTAKAPPIQMPKKYVELLNVSVVGSVLEGILLKLSEILENQKQLYEQYLELKKKQVELLERTARHEFD